MPLMHYALSSSAIMKDSSTYWLAIVTALIQQQICVFLSHLRILWFLISRPAGICMPHKSQRSRGYFPSCATAIRNK